MCCAKEALEVVDLVIRRIGNKIPVGLLSEHSGFILSTALLSVSDSFAQFPVCFTVELICSDEDGTVFLGCVEKDAVGGESFILINFDDVANLKIS